MNVNALKEVSNQEIPLYTVLKNLINKTDYINIGCISKVHNNNYVDVNLYYKNSCGKVTTILGVRLLHIGTTKCKINITPAVGDNVLLLCPRDFIDKLVYHRQPEKKKLSSSPYGEMNMCGILIKDEADDNVKTTISINENGDVIMSTEGNINVTSKGNAVVECEGNAEITSKQNCTVTSQNTKLTGGIVEIGGTVTPSGQGALCGIPYCPFSGAPHTGNQTQGA